MAVSFVYIQNLSIEKAIPKISLAWPLVCNSMNILVVITGPFVSPKFLKVCIEFPVGLNFFFFKWKTHFPQFIDKFLKF